MRANSTFDAIVIGGGAAGLFCASIAGRRGKRTLVVEHNNEFGRKIVVSGGGRCNFTNINTGPGNFVSQNPHFCKSALAGYTPENFIDLVRSHKIPYFEKKLGQLFCRESSRQIVEMLLAECQASGVKLLPGCTVNEIDVYEGSNFAIETSRGRFEATNLVISTGGLSFAKIGASDLGYRVAKQFGLKLTDTRPSLVAMVCRPSLSHLAGVSVKAEVTIGNIAFEENILFTHRGLSGPAVLQASNYWTPGGKVIVDLCPGIDPAGLLRGNSQATAVATALAAIIPERLARHLAETTNVSKTLANLRRSEIDQLVHALKEWTVEFIGTEGYDRAEVTLGGVSTDELNSKTMESKKVRGLYFIGEVVDVTGWLGGYNFQWAWSSGFAAGNSI